MAVASTVDKIHAPYTVQHSQNVHNPPNRIPTHQSIQNPQGKNNKMEELQDLQLAEGAEKGVTGCSVLLGAALGNTNKGGAAGKREPPQERGSAGAWKREPAAAAGRAHRSRALAARAWRGRRALV